MNCALELVVRLEQRESHPTLYVALKFAHAFVRQVVDTPLRKVRNNLFHRCTLKDFLVRQLFLRLEYIGILFENQSEKLGDIGKKVVDGSSKHHFEQRLIKSAEHTNCVGRSR